MARKLKNRLAFYGYREQSDFDSLSTKNDQDIAELKKKNKEQDEKDAEIDKKNKEQDEAIAAVASGASGGGAITITDGTPPAGYSKRYVVKQNGNEVGNIDIPNDKVVESASYNPDTNILTLVIANGDVVEIDMEDLIEDADLVQRSTFDNDIKPALDDQYLINPDKTNKDEIADLKQRVADLEDEIKLLKDYLDIEGDLSKDLY